MSGNLIKHYEINYESMCAQDLIKNIAMGIEFGVSIGKPYDTLVISMGTAKILQGYMLLPECKLGQAFGVEIYIVEAMDGFLLGNISKWRI